MAIRSLRKLVLSAIVFAICSVTVASSQTAAAAPKHHTVFQMSEGEGEWSPLIAHVTNLQNALQSDGGVAVAVIFFGDGINMLKKSDAKFAEGLKRLADRGVALVACQNSMHSRGIKTEDMFDFVTQVDSGVAELTRKQEAGWAYIK